MSPNVFCAILWGALDFPRHHIGEAMCRAIPWVLFATSLSANAQTDAPFKLVCHVGNDKIGYQDRIVEVDPKASMVGSNRATITEGEIKWTVETDEQTITTTISRATGAQYVSGVNIRSGDIVSLTGACIRSTERKF
jgi:hypothetical protein